MGRSGGASRGGGGGGSRSGGGGGFSRSGGSSSRSGGSHSGFGGGSRSSSGSSGGFGFGSSNNSSRSFGSGGSREFGGRSSSSSDANRAGANPNAGAPNQPYTGGGRQQQPYYGPGQSYGGGPRVGPMPMMGYGPRVGPTYTRRRSGGCLFGAIGLVLVVVLVLVLMFGAGSCVSCGYATGSVGSSSSSSGVTASTIEREPLPNGAVNETGYYTDELGWIANQTTLTAGMKNFYKATGVQPYLYITDNIYGSHNPTLAQAEQFANETYEALFTDEAHLLLIFFESGDVYNTWYLTGTQAKTVLDNEAMDILLDYIDRYYYESNMSDEEFFSKAFNDAGERIMSVTRSPWITVLVVLIVLAILVVGFLWWRSHKKQKNAEAEQTKQILETPLETFGDTTAEDLAKKYNNSENQNQ